MNIRKSCQVLALATCMLVLIALPAFAEAGTGMYVSWTSVSSLPGQGTSPHGGYATATVKCSVCHAVHGASNVGELLLASPASDACNYCHVGGAGGYTQVYAGNPDNYLGTDYANAHNSFQVGGVQQGLMCTTCHQVHAANGDMTSNPYLTEKLLRGDKTYNPFEPNYDPDPMARAPLEGDTKDVAMTKWCAGCHFTRGGSYSYFSTSYNQASHVMKAAGDSYSNEKVTYSGKVAWKDSSYCQSCHASDYSTAAWPHYTSGQRFLVQSTDASAATSAATNSKQDGVCLRCHRQNATGIGLTF